MPERVMELDIFGEMLYIVLCANGIQLVASVIEHVVWVNKIRKMIRLGIADSMLEIVHMKFKSFVEPDVSVFPTS